MATTAALTVQDAHKLQATQLHLVHRRITAIPSSLSGVTSLTSLDLSDNPLKQLQPQNLPASLKQLVCAGCQLSGSLPLELTRLTCLEQLVAPANSISRADAILACQHLVHVGLAYNNITTLLGPNSSSSSTGPATSKAAKQRASSGSSSSKDWGALAASQIVCLDLSHNDIMDLHSILQQLQQLPKLRVLHLRGNPVSLLPHFKAAVLHTLPQLAYLDGQKRDESTKTPPLPAAAAVQAAAPAPAPPPAAAVAPQPNTDAGLQDGACLQPDTCSAEIPDGVVLELELDKLQVTEAAAAVFKELADKAAAQLHQLMQQQQQHMASLLPSRPATAAGAAVSSSGLQDAPQSSSSGGAAAADSVSGGTSSSSTSGSTAQGSLQLPVAPLLAIRYHLEASKPDGSGLCSAAIVVHPPVQSAAEGVQAGSTASAAAAAAADTKKVGGPKGCKVQEASKAAAAAASKARPGSLMRTSTAKAAADMQQAQAAAAEAAAAAASSLRRGRLRVQMRVPADVATRDWLRSGFTVKLVRTLHQPQPVLPPIPEPLLSIDASEPAAQGPQQPASLAAAAPAAATGAGAAAQVAKAGAETASLKQHGSKAVATSTNGNSSSSSSLAGPGSTQAAGRAGFSSSSGHTAAPEGTTMMAVTWQQVSQRQELGTATVAAPSLLESSSAAAHEAAGPVTFMPPAPLMHTVTHIRLSLAEAQQLQGQPVGSCSFRIGFQH